MKKIQVQKCIAGIVLAVLLFIALYFGVGFPSAKAENTSGNSVVSESYDSYTDFDTLRNDPNHTIQQYPASLHATRSKPVYQNEAFALQDTQSDDPITDIVPKSLFASVGQTLHIGKEYGFFIKTNGLDGNYVSDVLVFDITTNTNFAQTIDRIVLSVSPIFQYRYAYIKASSTSLNLCGFTLNYSIGTDRVIPYPSSVTSDSLQLNMVDLYYLKDISYGLSLYNEQTLNRGDVGYDPYKDDGAFFNSIDYTYDGRSREFGEFPTEELVTLGLDGIEAVVTGINPVVGGAIGKVRDVLSKIDNAVKLKEELDDYYYGHEVEVSTGKLTTTCLYNTRASQLANYHDETGESILTKTAALAVNTPGEQSVWYGVNDNVTGYFSVTHTSGNVEPDYTRLVKEIGLKIMSASDDATVATEVSSYDHFFGERVVKNADDGDVECYTIKDGFDQFGFRPEYSDYYTIKNNGQHTINLKVINDTTTQTYQIQRRQTKRLQLQANTNYLFEAGGMEADTDLHAFLITISFDPKALTTEAFILSFDQTRSYQYVADHTGILSLSATGASAKIRILNEEMEVVSESPSTSNPKMELLGKEGQTYFVQIVNKSSANPSLAISYSMKAPSSSKTQIIQNNNIYFVMDMKTFGNYKFDVSSPYGLEMKIYDENLNQIYDTQMKNFKFTFETIGTYYIEFENLSSFQQQITWNNAFFADSVYVGSFYLFYNQNLLYNTYSFTPTTTAEYSFTASGNATVTVSTSITGGVNLGATPTLTGGQNYFIKVQSSLAHPSLTIALNDFTVLENDTAVNTSFSGKEYKFYKISAEKTGKHQIEFVNSQIVLYDRNLEIVRILDGNEFDAIEGETYYLKAIGVNGNNYSVKYYFNPPTLKINEAKVIVKDSYFKYVVETAESLRIKTFGVNSLTTKITYISQNVEHPSSNTAGHDNITVNWTPGLYYIHVEVVGNGFVGVSVEYQSQTDYTQDTNFQVKESEIYNFDFLKLETKNYYVNVSQSDTLKAFDIRIQKNVFTNFQLAVDGTLIEGNDLENGAVSGFSFILPSGRHVISLQFDTDSPSIQSDSINLIYLRHVDDLGLYMTETETGRMVRDGLRGGHSYRLQLDVNGKIVSDNFIVESLMCMDSSINQSLISYHDGILTVGIDAEFEKNVLFGINYAFVDYSVLTKTIYPFKVYSEVIEDPNQIRYQTYVCDYFTSEAIPNFSETKILKIELTGTIDSQTIYHDEIEELSFDLIRLNYYDNTNFEAKVFLINQTYFYLPVAVLKYESVNLSDVTNSSFNNRKHINIKTTSANLSIDKSFSIPTNMITVNFRGVNTNSSSVIKYLSITAATGRSATLQLNFHNFSFQAKASEIAVNVPSPLAIDSDGYVSIHGGNAPDWSKDNTEEYKQYATEGIYANDLTLTGSGQLTIRGGKGCDATGFYIFQGSYGEYHQKPGGNAARGLYALDLTVSVKKLYVYGGNGGHGGVDSGAGMGGMPSEVEQGTGGTGYPGNKGGYGGYGAEGAYITSIQVKSSCSEAYFYGGAGGAGANGQKGGKGGPGGPGKNGAFLGPKGTKGGKGGTGGRGGDGGDYGGGGNGLSYVTKTVATGSVFNATGGNKGQVGSGGAGGDGGDGGDGGKTWRGEPYPPGDSGDKGAVGRDSPYGGNNGGGFVAR